MTATPRTRRNVLLARLHVAAKERGLDEGTYRDLLERETGARSAADLALADLRVMVALLSHPRPDGALARDPQAALAYSLWERLAPMLPAGATLSGFVWRQTRRSSLEWCGPHELNAVVEALKARLARAAKSGKSPV